MKKNSYMSKIPMMIGLLTLMFFLIGIYFLMDANKKKESLTMRQNKLSNIPKKIYNSSKRNIRNKYNKIKKHVLG
jgi:hypothetical protein